VADPDQTFGGAKKFSRLHLFKHPKLSVKIVGYHAKVVTFLGQECGYFCWSNYAIFQGITTM